MKYCTKPIEDANVAASDIPMEYILITKAGFLSDGLLPAALQRLVDERDQWHALSLKHKQILRYQSLQRFVKVVYVLLLLLRFYFGHSVIFTTRMV